MLYHKEFLQDQVKFGRGPSGNTGVNSHFNQFVRHSIKIGHKNGMPVISECR